MIKRIVKLTFQEDKIESFKSIFLTHKEKIRNTPGCHHLELLQGHKKPHIFFTYSFWSDEAALDAYRQSELFKATWAKTKILFADRPEAWSVNLVTIL